MRPESIKAYLEALYENTTSGNRETIYGDALKYIQELETCLSEAIDLMEGIREGDYEPDSFTTQPWVILLGESYVPWEPDHE